MVIIAAQKGFSDLRFKAQCHSLDSLNSPNYHRYSTQNQRTSVNVGSKVFKLDLPPSLIRGR